MEEQDRAVVGCDGVEVVEGASHDQIRKEIAARHRGNALEGGERDDGGRASPAGGIPDGPASQRPADEDDPAGVDVFPRGEPVPRGVHHLADRGLRRSPTGAPVSGVLDEENAESEIPGALHPVRVDVDDLGVAVAEEDGRPG